MVTMLGQIALAQEPEVAPRSVESTAQSRGDAANHSAAIKVLLTQLSQALSEKDAEKYAVCFAPAYLEKEFGPDVVKRQDSIKAFLAKAAANSCSFEEVKVAVSADEPSLFHVTAFRHVRVAVTREAGGAKAAAALSLVAEFYEDVMIIGTSVSGKLSIESMESRASPARKQAVYERYIKEQDERLAALPHDDKNSRALALVQKAQYLQDGLGKAKEAETCLREAVDLCGQESPVSLALARYLCQQNRHEEALAIYRAVAAHLKEGDRLQRDVARWIAECEKHVSVLESSANTEKKP